MITPVMQREMIIQWRSPRALLMIVIVAGAAMVLTFAMWPTADGPTMEVDRVSRIFELLAWLNLAALIVMVPARAAYAVMRDRKRDTVGLLMSADLSRAGLMFGKLVGASAGGVAITLVLFAFAAACYAIGSIDLRQLLSLTATMLLFAVQLAGCGLLFGAIAGSMSMAIRMACAAAVMPILAAAIPGGLMRDMSHPLLDHVMAWLTAMTPSHVVVDIAGRGGSAWNGWFDLPISLWRYAAMATVTLVASLGGAAALFDLRRGVDRRPRRRALRRQNTWLASMVIFDRHRMLLLRDQRRWLAIVFVVAMTMSMLLVSGATRRPTEMTIANLSRVFTWLAMIAAGAVGPGLIAGVLAEERYKGHAAMWIASRYAAIQMVVQKLLVAIVLTLCMTVAVLPAALLMAPIDVTDRFAASETFILVALSTGAMVLLAAAAGSCCRSIAAAQACAHGSVGALYFGVPLLMALDVPLNGWVIRFCPMMALERVLDATANTVAVEVDDAVPFVMMLGGAALVVLLFNAWRMINPQGRAG